MPKGIRTVKLASPMKSGVVHTDDLAEREHTTKAVASPDHLVTAAILQPDTPEIVLAADLRKDYAAELKFNEEIVEITIAEDSSAFPIDPVEMSNNGQKLFIYRGVPTKIKRKFIECLCTPLVNVVTKQRKNNLDEDVTEIMARHARQFPFSVKDPNPRGEAWLRSLLSR